MVDTELGHRRDREPSLVEKLLAVHAAFADADIGHGFRGALALGDHDPLVDRFEVIH